MRDRLTVFFGVYRIRSIVLQNSPVTQHQIRYIVETALRHVNET